MRLGEHLGVDSVESRDLAGGSDVEAQLRCGSLPPHLQFLPMDDGRCSSTDKLWWCLTLRILQLASLHVSSRSSSFSTSSLASAS